MMSRDSVAGRIEPVAERFNEAYEAAPAYVADVGERFDPGALYDAGNKVLEAAQGSQAMLEQVGEASESAALWYMAAFGVGLSLLYCARMVERGRGEDASGPRAVEDQFDPTASEREGVDDILEGRER